MMINLYQERPLGTIQPVESVLQGQFLCHKLLVANVVISLCWGEATRGEGAGMELMVNACALGQYSLYSHAGCIHFVWIKDPGLVAVEKHDLRVSKSPWDASVQLKASWGREGGG